MSKKYYSTQRPISIGTYPVPGNNKVLEIKNFDGRTYVDELDGEAWGYIVYEEAVDRGLITAYELADPEWEDKAKIARQFGMVLKKTRAGSNIEQLVYHREESGEYVYIVWKDGGMRKVDVTADSGIAVIHDILKTIY